MSSNVVPGTSNYCELYPDDGACNNISVIYPTMVTSVFTVFLNRLIIVLQLTVSVTHRDKAEL